MAKLEFETFTETYGLLEKITVIEPADNACSEARVTKRIRRRPGASPLLFGRFLMSLGAFISLEDISEALPPYREEVVSVEMDAPLKQAYKKLEEDVKTALKEHRGNQSVMSVALNALLLYPDRPFRLGNLYGWEFDPETQRRERFLIAETLDLDERLVYAKERRLLEEVKAELARGRRCQIYAVYTQKRDVTRRLERILSNEGIRVAVLTTEVPPESREGWYDRQLRGGVQAVICHPKLVQTGPRPDRLSHNPVLRNRILDLRASPSQPEELENWAAAPREGEVSPLRRNDAGELPAADGQEAARVIGHGRQVLFGRIASDQRRRRHPHGDGSRAGHGERNRRTSRRGLVCAAKETGRGLRSEIIGGRTSTTELVQDLGLPESETSYHASQPVARSRYSI